MLEIYIGFGILAILVIAVLLKLSKLIQLSVIFRIHK